MSFRCFWWKVLVALPRILVKIYITWTKRRLWLFRDHFKCIWFITPPSVQSMPSPPPLPLFRCNSFSLLLMIPGYRYKQLVLNIQPNKSIWSYWICTTYMYSIKVNINMEDLFMLLPVVCTMCPHVYILMLHVNRIMMQVVKKKIYVNTFILHINIVYLACRDKSVPPYL